MREGWGSGPEPRGGGTVQAEGEFGVREDSEGETRAQGSCPLWPGGCTALG